MVWNTFAVNSGFLSTSSEMQHLADDFEAWLNADSGAPSIYWDALPHSYSDVYSWASTVFYYPPAGLYRVVEYGASSYSGITHEEYINGAWRANGAISDGGVTTIVTDGSTSRFRKNTSASGMNSEVGFLKLGDY